MPGIGREISRRPKPRPKPAPEPEPESVERMRPSQHVLNLKAAAHAPEAPPIPRPPVPKPPVPQTPAAPEAPPQPPPAKRKPWTKKRIAVSALKAIIVLAAAAGILLLNSIALPERLIGIYFVVAMVYAVDSQRTFLVALIFLIMVAVWSAMGNSVSAEDYAIYAFYFLVIGLVSAIREMVAKKRP